MTFLKLRCMIKYYQIRRWQKVKENIIITVKDIDKFVIKENSTIKELLKQVENTEDVIAAAMTVGLYLFPRSF